MKIFCMVTLVAISLFVAATAEAGNLSAKKARKIDRSHTNINCDEATTQFEMNECAGERLKLADEELNRLYKEKLSTLTADRESFRDMQRAWLLFRDKACLYEAGTRENAGTMWPLDYANCMEYHTNKRIEDLKMYIQCTQNGCPN